MSGGTEKEEPLSTRKESLSSREIAQSASEFAKHAEKLSYRLSDDGRQSSSVAVEARFVTPQDPVVITADDNRLPGVPLHDAHKLNVLREEFDGPPETVKVKEGDETKEEISNIKDGEDDGDGQKKASRQRTVQISKDAIHDE